jgi:hypothetical protein
VINKILRFQPFSTLTGYQETPPFGAKLLKKNKRVNKKIKKPLLLGNFPGLIVPGGPGGAGGGHYQQVKGSCFLM